MEESVLSLLGISFNSDQFMVIMLLNFKYCGVYFGHFLKQNVCQADDLTYVNLLNQARVGALTTTDINILQQIIIHPVTDFVKLAVHVSQH